MWWSILPPRRHTKGFVSSCKGGMLPWKGVIRNMTRTEPGEENDLWKGPVERWRVLFWGTEEGSEGWRPETWERTVWGAAGEADEFLTLTGRTSDISVCLVWHNLQINLFRRIHGIVLAVTTLRLPLHTSLTSTYISNPSSIYLFISLKYLSLETGGWKFPFFVCIHDLWKKAQFKPSQVPLPEPLADRLRNMDQAC